MGSHSVTCHPAAVTFPPLPQPKQVLNLAILEGCKAELTWWWLHPKIVYLPKMVTYLRNNPAVSWPGIEPATTSLASQPFDHQTTVCQPAGNEWRRSVVVSSDTLWLHGDDDDEWCLFTAGGKANIRKTDPPEHSVTSIDCNLKTDSIQGPLFGEWPQQPLLRLCIVSTAAQLLLTTDNHASHNNYTVKYY